MVFRTNVPSRLTGPREPITHPPTFEELAALEPRLNDLMTEARSYHEKRPRRFCANAVWYGYPGHQPGLKRRLSDLIGWESGKKGLLRSSKAYDVAYQALYKALPDCRHPSGECRPFHSPNHEHSDKSTTASQKKYLTFKELAALEPRLNDFLAEAKSYHLIAGSDFCAALVFLGSHEHGPGMLDRLAKVVGWHSGRDDYLASSDAYNTATCVIHDALPECGPNCYCKWLASIDD
jgi:hypothetical protein